MAARKLGLSLLAALVQERLRYQFTRFDAGQKAVGWVVGYLEQNIQSGARRKHETRRKAGHQIIEEFHDAGQRGDVQAFKRLLGKYGAYLPKNVKDQLIAEFMRNAGLLRSALREE